MQLVKACAIGVTLLGASGLALADDNMEQELIELSDQQMEVVTGGIGFGAALSNAVAAGGLLNVALTATDTQAGPFFATSASGSLSLVAP